MVVREATDDDLDRIIAVGARALGWSPGDPNEALFRWKHIDNVFGPSPIWVAEVDGRLAGYRAFMRWEMIDGNDRVVRTVRAVDTATDPDFQRQGVFSKLTMAGVRALSDQGVGFVFNTPNAKSRPGYLKLGWQDLGRLAVRMTPRSVGSLRRVVGARVPASKWSIPSSAGVPVADAQVIGDPEALSRLIGSRSNGGCLTTHRSAGWYRWRFGLDVLHYRAVVSERGLDAGLLVFRLRERGAATECAVVDIFVPEGSDRQRRVRELASALREMVPQADYFLALGATPTPRSWLPVPRTGPRLTVRRLADDPPGSMDAVALTLSDIELF